ncbi:MAG: 3-hydroxybutyryl-CoA dehydrogenase, partial [Anaerolineae bacterium]|nr:3-hydroxybutyryl-CoA dehydrogenase [Anaerolineae bacterium]
SVYTLTALAALTSRPDRVIGMHFINPVVRSQLVEVVPAFDTSTATRDLALEVIETMGKTAVLSGDFPGFISNRVLYPLLNEAITVLLENVGTVEAIDTVFRLGFEHSMGPLMLADYIGLDVVLTVMDALWDAYRADHYRASPLLRQMVEAGHVGRKSRRGFYHFDDTGRPVGPAYP